MTGLAGKPRGTEPRLGWRASKIASRSSRERLAVKEICPADGMRKMLFHNPLQSSAKSMVMLNFAVSRSEQSSGGKLADSTQDGSEGPVQKAALTQSQGQLEKVRMTSGRREGKRRRKSCVQAGCRKSHGQADGPRKDTKHQLPVPVPGPSALCGVALAS